MEKKVYRSEELFLGGDRGDSGDRPRYRVTIADPAGNLTALVEAEDDVPVMSWTNEERQRITRRIMRECPAVEQVGFVIPGMPEAGGGTGSLWRLEMAGGEFCGNAARSFGLFVARKQGQRGKGAVPVTVSGAKDPLIVRADTESGEAEVALPPPRKIATIRYRGTALPAVMFDGITHVIMEGIDEHTDKAALTETFFAVKETAYNALVKDSADEQSFAAFGVLFSSTAFLRPAVFVSGIENFAFENSCGSGSAAFAYYRARHLPDGEHRLSLHQPGGTITTRVVKETGKPDALFIGGTILFQ
ncbi:MAG: hypothetical protein LBT00_09695 [Spirochaetaceae bacterium]|jgi:diaminopimelate epimerase|nr:hypothetical protein [Spirochaetaceae bacterium]